MYSPIHPSCHHLQSKHVEVDGMNMLEVEGIDMVEKQDQPTNHQLENDDMNIVGSNMVELDSMYTVVEHFYLMNH
jgi:hypothetical protein